MSEVVELPPPPPWPFVEVIWEDSASSKENWSLPEELPDHVTIVTRGWLVKETKRNVRLVASYYFDCGEWVFGETVTIPKTAILNRRELGV